MWSAFSENSSLVMVVVAPLGVVLGLFFVCCMVIIVQSSAALFCYICGSVFGISHRPTFCTVTVPVLKCSECVLAGILSWSLR